MQIRHGIVNYDGNVYEFLDWLNTVPRDNVYIRWCLENEDYNNNEFEWFKNKTIEVIKKYPRLHFVGGFTTKGKYQSIGIIPVIEDNIEDCYWQRRHGDNIPGMKDYANANNANNKKRLNQCTWIMMDFVEIG